MKQVARMNADHTGFTSSSDESSIEVERRAEKHDSSCKYYADAVHCHHVLILSEIYFVCLHGYALIDIATV